MRSFERYVCAGDLGPARLIRIPGSGHSVYFERPDEFNRVIENFLRETPGELIDRERDRMGSPLWMLLGASLVASPSLLKLV